MDSKEKGDFRKLIQQAGNKVARVVTADIVDAYYDELKDFPLGLIGRAISYAYHDRSPEDDFLKTKMVSAIEIENAANKIAEEESSAENVKCPKCEGRAWIVEARATGQLVAHPCECLYNRAAEAMAAKAATARGRKNYRIWETIIKSYEAHQKR